MISTAVDQVTFANQVKVFPIITRGVVHIQLDNNKFEAEVFTITGQKLQITEGVQYHLELNMANYHPGMYILKIIVADQAVTKRVIRQ